MQRYGIRKESGNRAAAPVERPPRVRSLSPLLLWRLRTAELPVFHTLSPPSLPDSGETLIPSLSHHPLFCSSPFLLDRIVARRPGSSGPRAPRRRSGKPLHLKMVCANREMAIYCFDTLVAHYNCEEAPPPGFDEGQHPLFVTWKKSINGGEPRLRGCIGTLEARALINGFKDYALTSALRDRRFPPIQAKELPYLECTVSILTDYETALHYLDWEIGKHGLIIEFTDPDYNARRSATYLPEVAAHEGWTKVETMDSLMRKAGFNGCITESLRKRVRVTRYQSTLYTMHYSDYVSYVKRMRGSPPAINGVKHGH